MRYAISMLAVVLVAVAAVRGSGPIGPDVRLVNDDEAIQGEWESVAVVRRDNSMTPYTLKEKWGFRQGRFTFAPPSSPRPLNGTYTLNSQRNPPTLFLQCEGGGRWQGSYRLQGDLLHLIQSDGYRRILQRVKPPPPRPLDRLLVAKP
jgi:uncharacterized protein (TIGR03067 family)